MKQERIILSFIMVLIGLLVAGVIFYFYQNHKKNTNIPQITVSPTPTLQTTDNKIKLIINNPTPEAVVNNKNLTLNGKTNQNATVVVITKTDQQVIKPDQDGNFNVNLMLNTDQNLITIISILPSGESKEIKTVVTYSTSNF